MRVLVAGTSESLVSNFANVLEGGFLADGAPPFVRDLLASHQLLIAGERASLAEFLESRASRYDFDSARYPMYFSQRTTLSEIHPAYIRKVSATAYLEHQIGSLARHEIGLKEVVANAPDIRLLADALPNIATVMRERDSSAITRTLFAGRLASEPHEAATARLISSLYIAQHMDEFQCDIATGLRPLLVFDTLGTGDYAHDSAMVYAVLSSCGIVGDSDATEHILIVLRGSAEHEAFVGKLQLLCRALGADISRKHGQPARHHVARVLRATRLTFRPIPATQGLYEQANKNIADMTARLRSHDKDFAEEFEKQIAATAKHRVVLIANATKVESQAALHVAEEVCRTRAQYIKKERYVAVELGYINGLRLIGVQCEPGSVGPAASQAVITDAIQDFSPIAVILGGIAFGTKRDKQRLGDVLVSKMVVEYERAKKKDGLNIPRGQRIEAAPKLLSLFRAAEAQSSSLAIHVGTILSGEKLVDDKPFVADLLRIEPEAIGGEMEGAGLVAAAERLKTEWIVVKAIVDWGYDKASGSSESHQYSAARTSFQFIFSALNNIGL